MPTSPRNITIHGLMWASAPTGLYFHNNFAQFLRFLVLAMPNMRKCSNIIRPTRNVPIIILNHSQLISLDFAAIYHTSPTIATVQTIVISLRDILILRKKLRIFASLCRLFSVIADIMHSINHTTANAKAI